MTTKPKARKFRIRRNAPAPEASAQDTAAPQPETPAEAPKEGQSGQVSSARETATSQDIDEIRKEGLTGRQLRMARRMAQKHGLAPVSDFDAVRLLRQKGIDPFQRINILEVVAGEDAATAKDQADVAKKRVQLPQTIPAEQQTLPSTDLSPSEQRAAEIMDIQRDIAKRRRRKLLLLLSRLTAFVFLPTLIAGYYYYAVATPMYATKSEFLILTADGSGGSAPAGLFSGHILCHRTGFDRNAILSAIEGRDVAA